jgi:hypothetical protein
MFLNAIFKAGRITFCLLNFTGRQSDSELNNREYYPNLIFCRKHVREAVRERSFDVLPWPPHISTFPHLRAIQQLSSWYGFDLYSDDGDIGILVVSVFTSRPTSLPAPNAASGIFYPKINCRHQHRAEADVSWTFLTEYSVAVVKSSGNKASSCFRLF